MLALERFLWRVSGAMCVSLHLPAFIILISLQTLYHPRQVSFQPYPAHRLPFPRPATLPASACFSPYENPEDGINLFDCMTRAPEGSYSPFNLQRNEGGRLVASSVRCTFAQRQLDRNRVPSTTMSLAHCLSASFIRSPLQGQLSLRSHSKTSFAILPLHLAISHLAGRRTPLLADGFMLNADDVTLRTFVDLLLAYPA